MKKSFTLFELLIVIAILIIVSTFTIYKYEDNNLEKATNRLVLYLKELRYQALIDSKRDNDELFWDKKRWSLKFLNCNKNIGGVYYVIYSDTNMTGQPGLEESLSDPLTNKKIYSTNKCEYRPNTSKYVLLTKEFGIEEVNISCNDTSSIGQISFGDDGNVYTKLSNFENSANEYKLQDVCTIELKSPKEGTSIITIEGKTGFTTRSKY